MQWQMLYYNRNEKSVEIELKEIAMEVIVVFKNLSEKKLVSIGLNSIAWSQL